MTPRVSVNVPTYNSAAFVAATIEGILAQTFRDFELVVLDDGSTDGTADLVAGIDDPRIRVERQQNRGLGNARNRLLELSSGELIAFCDHDDIWSPNKLALEVAALDRSPEAALAYTDAWQVYETGRRLRYSRVHAPYQGRVLERLLADCFIVLSTVVVRRSVVIAAGGFPGDFQVAEEFALLLRVAEHHPIVFVPSPEVEYRLHAENSSRRLDVYVRETEQILSEWAGRDGGRFAPICSRMLGDVLCAAGRMSLLRLADPPAARRHLRRAMHSGRPLIPAVYWAASWLPQGPVQLVRRLAQRSMGSSAGA